MPGNAPEMNGPSSTKRIRIDEDIYSPLIVEIRSYWRSTQLSESSPRLQRWR